METNDNVSKKKGIKKTLRIILVTITNLLKIGVCCFAVVCILVSGFFLKHGIYGNRIKAQEERLSPDNQYAVEYIREDQWLDSVYGIRVVDKKSNDVLSTIKFTDGNYFGRFDLCDVIWHEGNKVDVVVRFAGKNEETFTIEFDGK